MRRNGIFRAPSKIPVRFGGIGTQRVPRSLRGRGRVNIYVREQCNLPSDQRLQPRLCKVRKAQTALCKSEGSFALHKARAADSSSRWAAFLLPRPAHLVSRWRKPSSTIYSIPAIFSGRPEHLSCFKHRTDNTVNLFQVSDSGSRSLYCLVIAILSEVDLSTNFYGFS